MCVAAHGWRKGFLGKGSKRPNCRGEATGRGDVLFGEGTLARMGGRGGQGSA